uniref:Partitioning defective 3 homolog B-like n=1 Tax=Stegastes partitus TaxID=144197 RepID=A0A3B5A709_9TELE
MKVTVTFGDTAVVVPCKAGWTVRDLVEQATRRYHRIQQQDGESAVKTHHLEYAEGGILDMDDLLSDLVEDRDKVRMDTRAQTMEPHTLTRTVEVSGDQGPLGIHVVPYCSSLSGRTLGLHIKGIEENSRSRKENIFKEDECIVQINDTPLQDKTFAQSQEVFRQAMSSSVVRLEVLPGANRPRYEKSLIGQLFTEPKPDPKLNTKSEVRRPDTRAKTPEPAFRSASPAELQPGRGTLERVSPTLPSRPVSSSPTPRTDNQSPTTKNPVLPGLANLTNKKGGKKIQIDLKKGTEGLGFTVVTRDSTVHGPGPILVKNILPRGAAIKDGRLLPGDRILEVNGVDMTGRSQEELVAMLRSTKQGENVCVVVARQEDIFLPRELKGEEAGSVVLEDGREQLMYEIPLNETGSAGLGVSLKGNKSRETGEDLGIFIKSIIHGGAAYKDGRLSVNDQMIAVNGESLLGRSNHAAMETLRRSMSSEGNARGTIQLVVLRAPRQGQQVCYQTSPSYPAAATNGSHYGNDDEESEQDFPPPPSPGAVEEMNRDLPLTPPHPSTIDTLLIYPSAGGALGPTLGLWKSSSLESLQTAMSEVKQSHIQAQVPFHRPRPHMVRGRGCNQSFRIAIDKSYDGPSEDDDDLSEHSSGHETPASSSSRQGLDEDGKKKKKTKPKKKEKKVKGKKKAEDSVDDQEKKTKRKGFGLLRFGKKKEDKNKDAAKTSKSKLEALSEEELDRIPDIHSGHITPDPASLPDVEDDDSDPNYARINNFRQPPSPRPFISRTPSPAAPIGGLQLPRASSEELDGIYAKVNKTRPPDQRVQGLRREYQQARAAPAYEELEVARRRALEYDPNRVSVHACLFGPSFSFRRDPYDYPTHSRPVPRDPATYPSSYHDPSSHPGRVPLPHSQQAPTNPRYYPSSPHAGQQHRAALRQDVPPSPGVGRKGRQRHEAARTHGDGYRQPSPGRYASPDRFPRARYTSPDRYHYEDGRQPDPRRKSPAIGAV